MPPREKDDDQARAIRPKAGTAYTRMLDSDGCAAIYGTGSFEIARYSLANRLIAHLDAIWLAKMQEPGGFCRNAYAQIIRILGEMVELEVRQRIRGCLLLTKRGHTRHAPQRTNPCSGNGITGIFDSSWFGKLELVYTVHLEVAGSSPTHTLQPSTIFVPT